MIRRWLAKFMIGRNGPDHLYVACVILSLVVLIIGSIFGLGFMAFIAYALLAYAIFRMLSRNITRRRAENDRFIRWWWPVRQKLKFQFEKLRNMKKYKFFKCPSCGNSLRVPRGKGKIRVTCPKCGERFERKT